MISISQKGIAGADEQTLTRLRQEFAEKRCVVLRDFVEERMLQKLMKNVESASFFENEHVGRTDKIVFATDLSVPARDIALQQINFLLNNHSHLFDVSPYLQHRVTETTGPFPRIAAAGWFLPEPRKLI